MPAPRIHRLRPDALSGLRGEQLGVFVFVLTCAAVGGFELATRTSPNADPLTASVVVAVAAIVAWAIDWRRRSAAWRRFFVTIGDDALEVPTGVAVHRITKAEATHVVRTTWPARGLVVRAPKKRPLFVPIAIEDYEDIEEELAGWRPIEDSRVPPAMAKLWPVVAMSVCALELVALGDFPGKAIAGASFVLALLGLWSLVNVLRSHRLGLRAKVVSLALLVPVGFLVWHGIRALS